MTSSDREKMRRITRRSTWKMLGAVGVAPFAADAWLGKTQPASAAEVATKPFMLPDISPIERAGEGDSTPVSVLRLDGTQATLVLIVRKRGLPEIAYWGSRLPEVLDSQNIFAARSPDTPNDGEDQWRPLITLLDTIGQWNFDMPGLVADRMDGTDWTAEFTISKIATKPGEIVVWATDTVSNLSLEIEIALGEEDVLSMRSRLTNTGQTKLNVTRLASGTILLPEDVSYFSVPYGSWAHEFGVEPVELTQGGLVVESRRNRTHDHFPGILAGSGATTQNEGPAYGAMLGWSGGHRLCAERMEDARLRLSVSEYLYPGEGLIAPGATLTTPSAYAAFSPSGYAGCARAFQAYARRHILCWPGGKMKPRPVLLNSWEGNHFNLDESRLRKQVDLAATLGIERFVLDDGWFGSRRDDTRGLGDWKAAASIFPQGLRPLSDYVHAHGMEFGLWYEPEMANIDSDVYREHPEWALQIKGRPLLTSRQQVALDISRPDVSRHLFQIISDQVRDWRIDYIKWDYNRDLADAADALGHAAYRRQVLALYALWDQLHQAHPDLEIESCASGGGRADWGALKHTQRVWLSDNSSALDRLHMQGHAWHFLPPEITGSHIAASPNVIDGRTTSLDYRAAIALFGHLGVELNLLTLADADRARLKEWIALHKRLRPLLHAGQAQFSNADKARMIRGVTSADGKRGVFLIAQEKWPHAYRPAPVRLPGLRSDTLYRVTVPAPQEISGFRPSPVQKKLFDHGLVLSGAVISKIGLYLPEMMPQSALLLECQPA